MPAASVTQIMDELAATLEDVIGVTALGDEGFQITGRLNLNPSEPSIDIYPADPFVTTEGAGYKEVGGALTFTVRARVAGDADGRQDLLLALMDDEHAYSIAAALQDDQSLNGLAGSVRVDGPSGYTQYIDGGSGGSLLGCEFRVTLIRARS